VKGEESVTQRRAEEGKGVFGGKTLERGRTGESQKTPNLREKNGKPPHWFHQKGKSKNRKRFEK